jgi:UDP-glucose 4-epimerase/UDP-glucuronate 4-epimerase
VTTLITGGAGFMGLAIAERLIAEGRRVVLFDLSAPPADLVARLELRGATCIVGDIRTPADVENAFEADTIEEIIHAAAVTADEQRERTEARSIVDVNIGGTVNVMERAAARTGIRRIVVLSSVAVYGFSDPRPLDEFDEELSSPAPVALYGVTKLAAEQVALRLGHLHHVDVRIARLGPVYGCWELPTAARDALSPHHQILHAALKGREAILPRCMRADWIYSRDAATGIAKICESDLLRYKIYHIGGGRMSDLVDWCRILASRFPAFRWKLIEPGEPPNIVYNLPIDRAALGLARISEDTGFTPAYSLQAALPDYLSWMKKGAATSETRDVP